jgi:hypothetical protein
MTEHCAKMVVRFKSSSPDLMAELDEHLHALCPEEATSYMDDTQTYYDFSFRSPSRHALDSRMQVMTGVVERMDRKHRCILENNWRVSPMGGSA